MTLVVTVKARRGTFELDAGFASAASAVAVEAASGAGKTTLLLGLAGLVPVTAARLVIDGRTVIDTELGVRPPPHRRRIGFVFQDARLFPHLTVAQNVAFGRRYAASPKSVDAALALVDMQTFGLRWPRTLSGGEARRVAIARALCADPQILLLDEPLTGLDPSRRAALTPYLERLRDRTRLPMIIVSHDPRDITALARDSVKMAGGRMV